jgi:hypothetical protein
MVRAWSEEREDLLANWTPGQCYGKQLTSAGWIAFEQLMPEALADHDDDWLVERMGDSIYRMTQMERRKPKGGVTLVNYNKRDALERLCLGEFNIAYVRGLARVLSARGETSCIVYRANAAAEERAECTAWEGQPFPVQQVLDGHRVRYHPPPGQRLAWSVPSGPNCHHSICAVAAYKG